MPPPRNPGKPSFPPAVPVNPATPIPTPASAPAVERSELKGSGKPKMPVSGSRQPSYDEIAARAYEIYVGRGYAAGDPAADWHEAERQLKAGL